MPDPYWRAQEELKAERRGMTLREYWRWRYRLRQRKIKSQVHARAQRKRRAREWLEQAEPWLRTRKTGQ